MVLLYYYLVNKKAGRALVVRNICTTHMLDKVAAGIRRKC